MTSILPRRNIRCPMIGAMGLMLAAVPALAQHAGTWKTGPALRQQLDASTSVVWSERPLREGLHSLSQAAGVAIFLDRRIDPAQAITLTTTPEPLEQLLAKIAERVDADSASMGPVVYIGPGNSAHKLASVAALRRQEAGRLPPPARQTLMRSRPWSWDDLAQPSELLDALAAEAGVALVDADLIPHDLWPAARLPSLAWTDRLSLLLAGFELTFELQDAGRTVRLLPMPSEVRLTQTYTPRGQAAHTAAELRRVVKDAEIQVERGRLIVSASQHDHERIRQLLSGQSLRTRRETPGQKVYTLTVENQPAGAVVRRVAEQLGKELKYDDAVLAPLRQKVSFAVQDVALEELLTTTLQPLGLTYRLDETSLEILLAP